MDARDYLITCEMCPGKERFDDDEFELHLRKKHKISLDKYKEQYPQARTEAIHPKYVSKEDIVARLTETEKKVDKKTPIVNQGEAFVSKKIENPDYVKEVLEKTFPEKWKYFTAAKNELVATGFPSSYALDDFVLFKVFLRDFNLRIMASPDAAGRFYVGPEDVKVIQQMADTAKKLIEALREVYKETREEKRIDEKLEEMLNEAENHIKQNAGELDFRCENCGAMINNTGWLHQFFEIEKDQLGKNVYLLWSDFLWEMVRGYKVKDTYGNVFEHRVPLFYMAYTLDTSIEGLIYTAKQRKMKVEKFVTNNRKMVNIEGLEFDLGKEEEQLKLCRNEFKQRYHNKSVRGL